MKPKQDFFCASCNRYHKPDKYSHAKKLSNGAIRHICVDAQKRIDAARKAA